MKPTQPRQPLAPCVQATWWLAWLAITELLATHHFIVQHTVLSAWFNLRHDCGLRHATCLLSQPVCLFVIVLDKWWVQISLCPSHYFGIYRWFKMYQDLLIGYYGNIVFQQNIPFPIVNVQAWKIFMRILIPLIPWRRYLHGWSAGSADTPKWSLTFALSHLHRATKRDDFESHRNKQVQRTTQHALASQRKRPNTTRIVVGIVQHYSMQISISIPHHRVNSTQRGSHIVL